VIVLVRKTLSERRAAKLTKLDELKSQIAHMEEKAALRFGKLAIRAGLVELNLNESELLRELCAIAARFRNGSKIAAGDGAHAPLQGAQDGKEAQHGC
jgi:hypothetical protein